MNWEQKLNALSALDDNISLKLTKSYVWTVDSQIEILDCSNETNVRIIKPVVKGKTPQEAVENFWDYVTKLEFNQLVVSCLIRNRDRRMFKWGDDEGWVPFGYPEDTEKDGGAR